MGLPPPDPDRPGVDDLDRRDRLDPIDGLVSRVRFRHLRLLLALQEAGSLGRAAGVLHLSQPALSKMLKEVEAAFGFALFERGSRGLLPTARGEVVLQGAAVMLSELRHVNDAAQQTQDTPQSVLHLGAPPAVAVGHGLAGVLRRLRDSAPHTVVHLHEDAAPRLFDGLMAGELDALITSYNQAAFAARRPLELVYERCSEHRYLVISPPGHALARCGTLDWAALVDAPWIMGEPALLSRQALDSQFLRAGLAVHSPVLVCNSPATQVRLVAEGLGLAAVPAAMADADLQIGRVARLRLAMTPGGIPTSLVYRAGSATNALLQALRAAVQAEHEAGLQGGAQPNEGGR